MLLEVPLHVYGLKLENYPIFAADVSSVEKFRLVRVSRRSRILIDAKFRG